MSNLPESYRSDIEATIRGYLVRDPEKRQTKAGKDFATATVALGVRGSDAPEFVSLAAFTEKGSKQLLSLSKGARIIASGNFQRSEYTDKKTGEMKQNWQLVCDWVG